MYIWDNSINTYLPKGFRYIRRSPGSIFDREDLLQYRRLSLRLNRTLPSINIEHDIVTDIWRIDETKLGGIISVSKYPFSEVVVREVMGIVVFFA